VFSKDGNDDCVVVSGDLDFDAPNEIRFLYNEKLSYIGLTALPLPASYSSHLHLAVKPSSKICPASTH
jgi:hypothetical protein